MSEYKETADAVDFIIIVCPIKYSHRKITTCIQFQTARLLLTSTCTIFDSHKQTEVAEERRQQHLVNAHLSTTLIMTGEGGRGWLIQVTQLATQSSMSAVQCEWRANIKASAVPENPIMFLCKHAESLYFNCIIKESEISALTVTSMEPIVSHFMEQQSWK